MIAALCRRVGQGIGLAAFNGFPFATPPVRGALPEQQALRKAARRLILTRWPWWLRPFGAVAMLLCWPVGAAILARRCGGMIAPHWPEARSLRLRAWSVALRMNVAPEDVVGLRMMRPGAPSPAAWMPGTETAVLCRFLAPLPVRAVLDDKLAFARHAHEAGLPTVPVLAAAAGGRMVRAFPEGTPPPVDLVVKPRCGGMGLGVTLWRWHPGGHRCDALVGCALEQAVLDGSRREALLIQPRLFSPCDGAAADDGTGPCVARMITVQRPAGPPVLALALVQWPLPGAFVSQGGPFRLVEPCTGRVLPCGCNQPEFGGPMPEFLSGGAVPAWTQAAHSVVKAHASLPAPTPLVAWDVAIAEDGPTLIEANLSVSLFVFQYPDLTPAWDSVGSHLAAWVR